MLLLRLRCHLPSTAAIIAIVAIAYLALHNAAGHSPAGLSLATEVIIAVGLAGLAAGTIAVSAVTIRRRRAAAGACHTCSHPCRGAMVPLPERDAQLWPHRPLTVRDNSARGARSTWTERGRTTTGSPVCLGNTRAAETAGS